MRPAAEVAAGALANPRISKADVDGYFAGDAPGLGGTLTSIRRHTLRKMDRQWTTLASPNDPTASRSRWHAYPRQDPNHAFSIADLKV